MSGTGLSDILRLCMDIDTRAGETYRRLAAVVHEPELNAFWESMATEESEHVSYWQMLYDLEEYGGLPPLFDNPENTIKQLGAIRARIDTLFDQNILSSTSADMLLYVARLEFYMLDSTFGVLLRILDTVPGYDGVLDKYENHVIRLVKMLKNAAVDSPEMELFGDIILRLWRENRKLTQLGISDPLTGLLNRKGFNDAALSRAFLAARRHDAIGVLMIDVDNFKTVNDRHGHHVGDSVLQGISGKITGWMRKSDIAGRFGGDEFVVLLSDADPESIQRLGEDILRRMAQADINRPPVTVSVGLAIGRIGERVEDDLARLIRHADECMYTAKRDGKNRIVTCRLDD